MTKFYRDLQGNYIGGFDGAEPPQGAVEVPLPPDNANLKWIDAKWQESADEVIARLERAIDVYLDKQAQSLRYESIRTLVTYENDPFPKFANEGIAGKQFRSACYVKAIEIMNDVANGLRGIPTEAELIAEMPLITDFLPAA